MIAEKMEFQLVSSFRCVLYWLQFYVDFKIILKNNKDRIEVLLHLSRVVLSGKFVSRVPNKEGSYRRMCANTDREEMLDGP